jgi:hypothetical protein
MSRAEKRAFYQRVRKLGYREFWQAMDELHTRAYQLAEQHYQEAMDIVLTPRQKAAVVAKAEEIRELWDGVFEISVDATADVENLVDESAAFGIDCRNGRCEF